MARHIPLAAVKLVAPLGRHAAIEVIADVAVQLVDIDRLQPTLQPIDLRTEAADGLAVVTLLDHEALAKRADDHVIDVLIKSQLGEQLTKLFLQHLLTNEPFRAFSVIAGAMIVDVFALLHFGREGAAAMATANQAGEGELADTAAGLAIAGLLVAAVQNVLNATPKVHRDEGLVAALVDLSEPLELAGIEAAPQDLVNRADGHWGPALAIYEPGISGHLADLLQGIAARRIPLEQPLDDRSLIGIDRDSLLAVRFDDVLIAEGRRARPKALLGLFQHSLADFLGEIVDIILRHQHLDAVHELFRRTGFPREDDPLLHQMDFGLQLVDRHPILEVAIEAIGLFDQHGLDGGVLAKIADHFAEAGAPAPLGGFHIDIFTGDDEPVGGGMFTQQLELGRNREALAFLLAR